MIIPMVTTICRRQRGGGQLRPDCSPEAGSERAVLHNNVLPAQSALVPLLTVGDVASGLAVFAVGVAILIVVAIVAHYLTKRGQPEHVVPEDPQCEHYVADKRCTEPGFIYTGLGVRQR